MSAPPAEPLQDLERPARKQVERPVITEPQRGAGADVNIWSGRRAGERAPKRGERALSQYRCRPALDTGRTRGSQGRVGTFCSYFARGLCAEGPACRYLHRLPTAADAAAHVRDNSQDIFGRERLPDRLDNRCGAGSYDRDSRTLYVAYGGAGGYAAEEVKHLLVQNFGVWGPLRGPPFVVPSKAIAFVRYHWRASAEFAKEAMHGQGLDGSKFDEVLAVRWADDDPNPGAVAARKRGAEDMLEAASLAAWDALPAEERRARLAALQLARGRARGEVAAEYPDTDAQYQQQQQQQQEQGHYGTLGGAAAGAAGEEEYAYPDTDAQYGGAEVQQAAAAGGAWAWDAAAGQWVWQWDLQPGGAGAESDWEAYARKQQQAWQQQQQQQQQQQKQQQHRPEQGRRLETNAPEGKDGGEGAEALGLLAAYGSESDTEGGDKESPAVKPQAS